MRFFLEDDRLTYERDLFEKSQYAEAIEHCLKHESFSEKLAELLQTSSLVTLLKHNAF